jgi:hypothetical protein
MVLLMWFLQSFSISRVNYYDEFCYSNKTAIVSKAKEKTQHFYGLQSLATNIPARNTSSAELCSVATDEFTNLDKLLSTSNKKGPLPLPKQKISAN